MKRNQVLSISPRTWIFKKDGTSSKEGILIKSTVDKASKITPSFDFKRDAHQPSGLKEDSNNIQDEKDIQIEVPNVTTGKESKEVEVDIKKNMMLLKQRKKHH